MRFTLIFLGWFLSSCALAAVYKCTDAKGNTDYQAKPCAEGQENISINIKTGTVVNLNEEKKQQELSQKQEVTEQEKEKNNQLQLLEQQKRAKDEIRAESAKNQEFIKTHPDTFSPYSMPPYDPEHLSDLVKLHQARLVEIERFRREAAEKALRTGECTRVEASELDINSTKTLLAFLINCTSGKAFHINEQDLKR